VSKVYRARTIKRDRRTNARQDQLDEQIIAALAEYHPQSVRHVFYLMTNPRLHEPVEKSDRGYRHVQHRCTELRRSDRLPFHWFSDTSRRGYFVNTFDGAADFVRRMAGQYRANLWEDAEYYCEVWCESRSIGGVILADCKELGVSLYPAGGFSSLTFVYEAAQQINIIAEDRPVVIYYIGDYDPAGVTIDRSIEAEMRTHLDDGIDLTFERLGITEEQIEKHDLPTKPRKAGDKRSLQVKSTVEAEAMPVHVPREILRDAVESLLPEDALRVNKVAEESERAGLLALANRLDKRRA
jgi:hypothetical protein